MKKAPVTVVILTLNEEIHIERAIKNVKGWCEDVFILDSGSTDKTKEISEQCGAKVFHRDFDTYAKQRNHAIQKLPIETDWMLFLDADEYLFDDLKEEISQVLTNGTDCNGFYLKRRFYFRGKWIKYGGYYPTNILRLFKKDKGICERDINEHFNVEGKVETLKNDFVDDNLRGISDWVTKHNKYADFEARELFLHEQRQQDGEKDEFAKLLGTQAQRKRWIREYIWNPLMPKLFRPFVYYFYRYFIKFGFLDGKWGFVYHFLHGLWFYLLIDVKYMELKQKNKEKKA